MGARGGARLEQATSNGLMTRGLSGFGPEQVEEVQRARLLAAMAEVCAERGAGDVTVAYVVDRAGVSRRTFYELFTDREDCFLATFDKGVMRARRYVLDALGNESEWAGRIRAALTALLEFCEVERDLGRLLVVGSLGAGAKALERRGHVLAQIIGVVDGGREHTRAGTQPPPPLMAEGVVGGVLSVLHARLSNPDGRSLLELTGPLMSMIVLPYLGSAAARKELKRPVPARPDIRKVSAADPLRDVEMRLTYRTVRVLTSVATYPGSSNREIGSIAGIGDQGQISKLLTRLVKLQLIQNTGAGQVRGGPNAWTLTAKGLEIEQAIGDRAGR